MEIRQIKILAIDSNHESLISIDALIKHAFADAIILNSSSGESGIELARIEDPDVILLDKLLSEMDSFEFCKKLKSDKKLHDIPVVFITSDKDDKKSRMRAIDCGADAFLTKPFEEWDLIVQIRAMVKIKTASAEKVFKTNKLHKLEKINTLSKKNELNERKIAKQTLNESEDRFELLFNNAPLGYQSLDENGNILEVNQQWLDLLGYQYDDVNGKWFGDFISANNVDSFKTRFPIFKAQGHIHSEFEMVHKNGAHLFIAFDGRIGYDIKGNFKQTHCILQDITERRNAEKALSESEERFELAMKASEDGLFDWNLETDVIYYSPGWKRMVGYENHELPHIISVWENLIKPEDLARSKELHEKLISKEIDRYVNEVKLKHKKGHWVDILSRAEAIFNDKGKAIRIIGTHVDITKRKRDEDELKKLKTAIEKAEVSIVITDSDANIEYANPYFSELTGYSKSEYEGKNPNVLGSGFHPVEFYENLWDTITSDKTWKGVFYNKKKNGEFYWENAIISPITNNENAITHFVAIKSDITSERLINEELIREKIRAEESETKYKQIFDNTFDIMSFYEVTEDNRFKVITFNSAEEKLIGSLENYQGKYIDECIPPDLYATFKPHYDLCISEEKLIEYEEDISFLDVNKTFQTQLIPLKNSKGKVYRIIVISRDISDLKKMQLQLIDQNEKLKFLNQDLIISKEKAEQSDKLKSAFLANMSHEIRTPMNGILGFSELLKNRELSGTLQQEYISIIEKSGQRMLSIVNDIIDISKIEAGLMKFDIKETNINEKIDFIYLFFKPQVEEKGMKLYFKKMLSRSESIIFTDSEKVYSILTNLVKNAIKYSNTGEIEFGYNKKDEFLEFYVKDTGIGIPKDRHEAIFERFIQADISNKMARQGAGLGLSISKAFVEKLGGEIWVESEVGKGSTFYFTLPYNHKTESVQKDNLLFEGALKQNDKLNILIAEDDPSSEYLISLTVREFSRKRLTAKRGSDAVEICRTNPDIDLILMDIQMPDLNGYEATKKIREFNKDVIIIAQTAFGLSGDKEKSIEAGCNDYIQKPISKYEIKTLIQQYCHKREAEN